MKMNPREVAAILGEQAAALEHVKSYMDRSTWRHGVTPDHTVAKAARRACAAWAWIVRHKLGGCGEFTGWAFAPEPVNDPALQQLRRERLAAGDRRYIPSPIKRRAVGGRPWARLDEFARWASGLSGVKGMPPAIAGRAGHGGDAWVWALKMVAEWLDSVTMPAKGDEPKGFFGKVVALAKKFIEHPVISTVIAGIILGFIAIVIHSRSGFNIMDPSSSKPLLPTTVPTSIPK